MERAYGITEEDLVDRLDMEGQITQPAGEQKKG